MTTTKTPKVTETQAKKVLAAVRKQSEAWIDPKDPESGPKLVMDWDWLGYGPTPSIIWEEGPYEWAYLFPFGGIEEEFGSKRKDVSALLPAKVWTEAATSWAIHIYRKDA